VSGGAGIAEGEQGVADAGGGSAFGVADGARSGVGDDRSGYSEDDGQDVWR
jgi:hypothetical protein